MDWIKIFEDNRIDYTTGGKNTARGVASIKCPWCGDNDTSMHMGCHPIGWFNCWRDSAHKGNAPHRLISALLGVNKARARLLAQTYGASDPDSFDASAAPIKAVSNLSLDDFYEITETGLTSKFYQYVIRRGFEPSLFETYKLKAALYGRYNGRLIIPIFDAGGALIGWQGRAIAPTQDAPRYLSEGMNVKDTIYNLQHVKGGEVLFVCEGPFDAMKIDFYGHELGARATATFGVIPKPAQLQLLREVGKRFKQVVLLLDADPAALQAGYYFSDYLPNVRFGALPNGVSDPGMLTKEQVRELCQTTMC